ncbi:hypothetical protein PQR75_13635 [Paraburkholderia fungorum]|uniref:hypothetical protein n=1 Tax=Paraburkholderia fungorum TaxID=134537 RepID=UPI0038BBD5DA
MTQRAQNGHFLPGVSGNPGGRLSAAHRRLRELMEADIELFYAQLVAGAKAGDATCLRIYFDRIVPALKPGNLPMQLPALFAANTLTEATRAITDAVARAELSIEDGAKLLAGLGAVIKVEEHDEVMRRLEALEGNPRNGEDLL